MDSIQKAAQDGLSKIENAIIELLRLHPEGLTNAEIARELAIEIGEPGEHRNMLTWSILGRLLRSEKIEKFESGKRKLLRLQSSL